MKPLALIFTLLLLITSPARAQFWGKNTESAFTNEAMDVEIDAAGNHYVTGYITGETAFDPTVTQSFAPGNGDIYVAKYSPGGQLLWIKQFGGNFSDKAYDLAIGPDQHIVITGQFFGQVNFGAFTLNSDSGSKDIFLAKLDPFGNIDWARSEGANLADNAFGITVDHLNNVILTGQFRGTGTLANQAVSSTLDPVSLSPGFDLFISKYDPTGTPLWTQVGAADYDDRGLAVHTDSQNNIFMTGQFSDTLVLAGQTFLNNAYNVGFLAKFSPTGQFQWMSQLRAGQVIPYDVEINNVDEAIITGDFRGNMLYMDASGNHPISNPYNEQIFVIKASNNGQYIWNKTFGSDNDVSARSVSIDNLKDIYITGFFKCGFSELQENNQGIFNAIGFKDPYLIKISNSGSLLYSRQIGGQMDDEGHGVAIHTADEPVVCGSYTQDLLAPIDVNSGYTTSFDDFNLEAYWLPEAPNLFLEGDSTRNSFLLKAISNVTPDLNYFVQAPTDTLFGFIHAQVDTVHFCVHDSLIYQPQTYPHFGPSYLYQWNTGDTTHATYVASSGTYSVTVTRNDQCVFGTDSIEVIIHTPPPMPLLTDNEGIGISTANYPAYDFCAPDSIQVWFNNIDTTCSFSISDISGTLYTDSLPHWYSQEGSYSVTVSDAYCTVWEYFLVDLDYTFVPDSMDFYLHLVNGINDSIAVCEGQHVVVFALDSLSNPSAQLINMDSLIVHYGWSITPSVTHIPSDNHIQFVPQTSGWYVLSETIPVGYDNQCGIDTTIYHVTDSFYVTVNPMPTANAIIQGDNLLCPNGSVYLSITNIYPSLSWSGPSITWTSPDGDSVQVTTAGTYHYLGIISDSVTGCSAAIDNLFTLIDKTAPDIASNPTDGIICPYDSVLLSIPDIYLSYDWIGPQGDTLSNTNELYGSDQGFYYCHVLDAEGCMLTSPPAEILEYTTPYLMLEPGNVICPGEEVTVSLIYFGDATIQWAAPLSSSTESITIDQPGVYHYTIQQCGITLTDSIEIIEGSSAISITADDTLLCYGEISTITAPAGFNSYEWSNGIFGINPLQVNEPGSYWVEVINGFGCESHSDTIVISIAEESVPPAVPDTTVCPATDVQLVSPGIYVTNWFSSADSTLIGTGAIFNFPGLLSDTTILVAYASSQCAPAYQLVTISIADSLPSFTLLGDSLLCPNENAFFSIDPIGFSTSWSIGSTALGSGSSIEVNQTAFIAYPVITAIVSAACFTDTVSEHVYFAVPEILSLNDDSLQICAYSEVPLVVTGNVDEVTWTGNFGSYTGEPLLVNSGFGNGWIDVSGIDLNGCATNMDSIYLETSSLSYNLYSDLGNSCTGDSVSFGVNTSADSLIWQTPAGQTGNTSFGFHIDTQNSGWYYLTQWDTIGCVYEDSLFIPNNEIPMFELGTDSLICLNDIFTYYFPSDTNTYSWTDLGATESFPIYNDQLIILTATSPQGCTFSDTLFVHTVNCDDALPNVITPNGDGINDYFVIDEAILFPNNQLQIVNRWGNVIFKATGYRNEFRGEHITDGTYFYVFFPDPNNEPENKKEGFLQITH